MQGLKRKSRRSESVRERTLDMTTGPIWRNMVAFAVPVFLGQLFQQLYNTADSMIVGNFSGKDALAAVASSGNLIFMLTGFFMGVSLGAGVVISRYFGAKDYERMDTIKPDGTYQVGEDGFMEFYPDADALQQAVLQLFYEKVE